MPVRWSLVLGAAAAAVVAACGSGGGGPSGPPTAVLQKAPTASGDAQSGAVTTTLASPLRVLVTLSGTAHAGDMVTWAASGPGASVTPTSSATDANGIATTTWTLGQTAGTETATASLAGATNSPVTFTALATPGAATRLSLASGNAQTAFVNGSLANPLKVIAADQFGNGVSGVGVTWLVTSGSGTVTPAAPTTDATGTAQATVTLGGTAGPDTITATSTGLTGSPVKFHETAAALPTTASVNVGNIFFASVRNTSQNPAVDTIAVGGSVTWTWGGGTHTVQSTGTGGAGSSKFTSSGIQSTGTYSVTFTVAGIYPYNCAVHGNAMTGMVVVQ